MVHPKLREIIHTDFFDLKEVEKEFSGYNACFFCLGVSSLGKKEEMYTRLTYQLTLNFAQTVLKRNAGLVFCYISGAGTDGTESGNSMWARIKGKTENDLLKLPFKKAYMFRPGYIQPTRGLRNTLKAYKIFAPFYPVWKFLFPKYVIRLSEVGKAMINCAQCDVDTTVLECSDIRNLALMEC
jgi:hypothetical protein